jgi:hypothetical protein
MNELLSFDKNAVTNFSVLANVSIYCALSQFRGKYDRWWEKLLLIVLRAKGIDVKKILPQSIIGTPSFGKRTIHRVSKYKFNSMYFQFHMRSTIT